MDINGIVRASECDSNANINIVSIFSLIEDSITILLGKYGLDSLAIKEKGLMWVFTKNKVNIYNRPKWKDNYVIKTHVIKVSMAIIVIETSMYDSFDNLLFESITEACVLDIKTRRIIKLSDLNIHIDTLNKKNNMRFERISLNNDFDTIKILSVSTTNIDYSLHTNNVEYVRFLSDSLNLMKYNNISSFEIHFTHESVLGDVLHVKRYNDSYIITNLEKDIVCEAIIK